MFQRLSASSCFYLPAMKLCFTCSKNDVSETVSLFGFLDAFLAESNPSSLFCILVNRLHLVVWFWFVWCVFFLFLLSSSFLCMVNFENVALLCRLLHSAGCPEALFCSTIERILWSSTIAVIHRCPAVLLANGAYAQKSTWKRLTPLCYAKVESLWCRSLHNIATEEPFITSLKNQQILKCRGQDIRLIHVCIFINWTLRAVVYILCTLM